MNPAPPSLTLETAVEAEAIRQNFANMPAALYSSAIAALFVTFAVAKVVPAAIWGSWLFAMYAQVGVRWLLLRAYRRKQPAPFEHRRWGLAGAAGAALSGLMWGIAALVLVPAQQPEYLFFMTMVVAVLATTAGVASASYWPALFGFYVPAMLPLLYLMFSQPEGLRLLTGAMLAIYLPIFLAFVWRIHRSLVQSIRLHLEKAALAEQLAQRTATAENATREKSRFLAAASHDLRQPVHVLALFVESLKNELQTTEQHRLLGRIEESMAAMDGLFHALLDISRLDAGTVTPTVRAFPVQQLLDRITLAFAGQAQAAGLRLAVVPSTAWIDSDPALCEQLLHNLVSNALRYTRSGGVVIGCRHRGQQIDIEVWDTGIGIAAPNQQEIFEEFVQLGNAERDRSKGLGLGLAIVRRLADLLHAPLMLSSTEGRGSRFGIRLPRAPAQAMPGAPPTPSNSDMSAFKNHRVAVIDDEAGVRDAMTDLLQRWGLRVIAAASAAELLATIDAAGHDALPDAILCDYRLRDGHSGIDAIRLIREEFNRDIPALLITADTGRERLQEALASGLPLLHKPVQPRLLRSALAALLRSPPAASG